MQEAGCFYKVDYIESFLTRKIAKNFQNDVCKTVRKGVSLSNDRVFS